MANSCSHWCHFRTKRAKRKSFPWASIKLRTIIIVTTPNIEGWVTMIQYLLPLSANETQDAQQLLCLYVFFSAWNSRACFNLILMFSYILSSYMLSKKMPLAHTKRTGDKCAEWDKEGDTNISIEYVLNKWILIERIRDFIQPFIIDLCLLVLL